MAEGGVAGFDITVWWGLFGPANLPPAVVQKIATTVNSSLSFPDLREDSRRWASPPLVLRRRSSAPCCRRTSPR